MEWSFVLELQKLLTFFAYNKSLAEHPWISA